MAHHEPFPISLYVIFVCTTSDAQNTIKRGEHTHTHTNNRHGLKTNNTQQQQQQQLPNFMNAFLTAVETNTITSEEIAEISFVQDKCVLNLAKPTENARLTTANC